MPLALILPSMRAEDQCAQVCVYVFFTLTDRTLTQKVRGCQSGTWSAGLDNKISKEKHLQSSNQRIKNKNKV